MAGFWGRRKRNADEITEQDEVLAARAAKSLVAADEKLRLTQDEVAFATAELGEAATADLRAAIEGVRTAMSEAFKLHQLNVDDIPDTPQELRERNARIVQLTEWAEDLLETKTGELEVAVAKVREAPAVVESVQEQSRVVRARLEETQQALARLAQRYSPEALHQVDANGTEAEQLLGFADHSLQVAARRREAGQSQQATMALEAATESVRRATTLIEAVEHYEIEALRAESTLSAVVADSRSDLVAAREAPPTPEVAAAMTDLQQALASLPAPGALTDPFALLTRVRSANTALDAAVDKARERAARPAPSAEHLTHAVDDAKRQLAVARDVIAGHRGYVGADARTRLAEAENLLTDVYRLGSGPDDRERAMSLARRAADLASQALQLAQRDIDSERSGYGEDSWGAPGYGRRPGPPVGFGGPPRRGGFGGMAGGILGGMVLGEILEDFFD
ncbi:hypothetical protein [Serinibacter salmoneus]|uniref:TLP18.3/Psb32/MOLO-1 phosphatase superfamily protein n=1 Tax=Serinibacter salmoneus TaxID=556530 RepID=A0A2A9D0H1_9MICO|nr:hypothetical protein [Serinibacter salmoneus]PFG20198.1 hypothetical protein ATL40_1787 [Serinibacter salmoneus]